MGRESDIAWTHATFNPWEGCEKVSEGCAHCYAEQRNQRFHGGENWGGAATPRLLRSEAYWREPQKWNALAEREGARWRVFCASLADVFEDRADLAGPRDRLFGVIEQTPALDWLLLTKRPQHMRSMLPAAWLRAPRANVWLGTTAENQRRADERIPELLATPAAVRFVSAEPLLEDVDLTRWLPKDRLPVNSVGACADCGHDGPGPGHACSAPAISWVIIGGESEERSGPAARSFHLDWGRKVVQDCASAGVSCFVKQMGSSPVDRELIPSWWTGATDRLGAPRFQHPKGADPAEWPEELRVRQFPRVAA